MLTFLYVVQFVVTIGLTIIVMFQKTEGGTGLISSNQYNSFFSAKSFASNPLTKITIILGFVFFLNCIIIAGLLISKNVNTTSVADQIEAVEQEKKQQNTTEIPLG